MILRFDRPFLFVLASALVLMTLPGCGSQEETSTAPSPDVGDAAEADGDVTDAGEAETDGPPLLDVISTPDPACPGDDPLAGNTTPEQAHEVGGAVFQERGLFVCPGVSDWFRVDVDASQRVLVRMRHVSSDGLLNLYLYPPGGPFDRASAVAASESDTDEEAIEYVARDAGTWLIEVAGLDAQDGGAYDLRIGVSCAADDDCDDRTRCSLMQGGCVEVFEKTCGFDAFEDNDRVSEATPLSVQAGAPASVRDVVVCEDDEDYFEVVTDEVGTLTVTLAFDPGADLDLGVFAEDGTRVGLSATREAPEEVVLPYLPAGIWRVGVLDQVAGLGFDVSYSLDVRLDAEACSTNRACAAAPGRPLCVDGACVPFDADGPVPPGEMCEQSSDCAAGYGCYQGGAGIDDNFCTQNCNRSDECGFLEDGYCLEVGQTRVCLAGCSTDADCPTYYACGGEGQCGIVQCDRDEDCDAGRLCRRTEQQGIAVCTDVEFGTCADDDRFEPNDTDSQAVELEGRSPSARGLTICDDNDDWFVIEVPEDGTTVDVAVDFDTEGDLDVYVYDARGRLVGAGTEPDANPERAEARALAAGRYWIRIDQFPGERDTSTLYNLVTTYRPEACDEALCLANQPIRPVCSADACVFIEGAGEVEPGGLCDSNDDCSDASEFCWVFEPATSQRNICTRQCISDEDCEDVGEGVPCQQFGRGFAACLP